MLKVLIVENETLDRVHLKTMIDWEDYGYQLVGEAENGSEGLGLIARLEPDIVITDIRMPVINGLELMSACSNRPKKPRFLIMSGYDDYDLVRRGLTLGAYDYLRKFDVNSRSLLEALGGIRSQIGARGAPEKGEVVPDTDPAAQARMSLLGPVLRGQPYDEADVIRQLGQTGVVLLPGAVHCGLIRIDEPEAWTDLPEAAPMDRSVVGIVDEILREAYSVVCLPGKGGQFMVMASPRDPATDSPEQFERTLDRLLEMLDLYLNVGARAGVGSALGEPLGLQTAYQRAAAALKNRFFFEGRLILWHQVPGGIRQEDRPSLFSQKEELRQALDAQRKDGVREFFERFCEDMGRWEPASSVKEALIELNYLVREYFEVNQLDPARFLPHSKMTYEDIGALQDVGQARRWVKALAEDLGEFLAGEARVEYSRVILHTKRYVAEHYGEDLTLATVAVRACLSPNYFSSIFKRHSGMSFTEYLNTVRISAAKHLLAETDLLIYEVAEKCGYHDSYYFNRVFKRVTGTSPGSYRKVAGPGTES